MPYGPVGPLVSYDRPQAEYSIGELDTSLDPMRFICVNQESGLIELVRPLRSEAMEELVAEVGGETLVKKSSFSVGCRSAFQK